MAQDTDRSNIEAESDEVNDGWNNSMISRSENTKYNWPTSISGRLAKLKGKDKQKTVEQIICRPRLLTDFTENPTPTEITADTGVEWGPRLTSSKGALVL